MNRNKTKGISAVVLKSLLAIPAVLTCAVAMAESTPTTLPAAYRMAVIIDAAYGEGLMAGEFAEAISGLTTMKISRRDKFVTSNNLCVAYVLAKEIDRAESACNKAVIVAARNSRPYQVSGHDHRRDHAVALTNRGVVRALTGDETGAAKDFNLAIRLRSRLTEPGYNLVRLKSRTLDTVAGL